MKIWYCYIFNAVLVTVYFKDNVGIRINACLQKIFFYPLGGDKKKWRHGAILGKGSLVW